MGVADSDLLEFLCRAVERYRTVRIAVWQWADRAIYMRSLLAFSSNPRVQALLSDATLPRDGIHEAVWRAWVEFPGRWRVEYLEPPHQVREISGGDDKERWQYFPAVRRAHFIKEFHRQQDAATRQSRSTDDLHPVVGELLDPSFLCEVPEGYTQDPTLELRGEVRRLGRKALIVGMKIGDWQTRDAAWGENVWIADEHELLVDAQTGILLRVASRLQEQEFSVTEAFDLAIDVPLDRSLFSLRPPPTTRVDFGSP